MPRKENLERRRIRREKVAAEREARRVEGERSLARRSANRTIVELHGRGLDVTFDFSNSITVDFDPNADDPLKDLAEKVKLQQELVEQAEREGPKH